MLFNQNFLKSHELKNEIAIRTGKIQVWLKILVDHHLRMIKIEFLDLHSALVAFSVPVLHIKLNVTQKDVSHSDVDNDLSD